MPQTIDGTTFYNELGPNMPAPLNGMGRRLDEMAGFRQGSLEVDAPWERLADGYMYYSPQSFMEMAQVASTQFQDMSFPRQYERKVHKALEIFNGVQSGSRMAKATFMEALSYDDFNYIMQDVLYRRMLDKWKVPRTPYESFAKEIKSPSLLRPAKMFTLDGLEGRAPQLMPGQQPEVRYPQDSAIGIRPYKYGFDVEILWETLIEDDLNALGDIPDRLNNAFQSTIGRLYTGLYAGPDGFRETGRGDLFRIANNDKILNPSLNDANPAGVNNKLEAWPSYNTPANGRFNLTSFQAARAQVGKFLSPVDRYPIDTSLVHMVYGSGMQGIVDNVLLGSVTMERAGGEQAAGDNGMMRISLPAGQVSIQKHMDPYLHVVVDDMKEDTMWMLLADPGRSGRPLFFYCVLAGYEQPMIARRIPNYRGVGSGAGSTVDWISTGFRMMFIRGADWGDPRGGIASDGQ